MWDNIISKVKGIKYNIDGCDFTNLVREVNTIKNAFVIDSE